MAINATVQYELESLPDIPFAIYFLDENKEIKPRKMFTASKKRLSNDGSSVELFIVEFNRFVQYGSEHMVRVNEFFLN